MVNRGYVKDGRIELDNGGPLPEGVQVRIELVEPETNSGAAFHESLGRKLLRHAGTPPVFRLICRPTTIFNDPSCEIPVSRLPSQGSDPGGSGKGYPHK